MFTFFVTIVSAALFLPCELACRADQDGPGFPASIFLVCPSWCCNAWPDGLPAHRQSALSRYYPADQRNPDGPDQPQIPRRHLNAPLFSNLDLTIGAGDRLGIVAANGRGKSTLLKCLERRRWNRPSGDITRSRGLRIGHVEQAIRDALLDCSFQQAVADALPAEQARERSCGASTWCWIRSTCREPMRERPMRA